MSIQHLLTFTFAAMHKSRFVWLRGNKIVVKKSYKYEQYLIIQIFQNNTVP